MGRLLEFGGPLVFAFWIFCVLTVIMTPESDVRHLPKYGWLILVLFFPVVGGVAWIVLGRDYAKSRPSAYERSVPQFPEYDRPGRFAGTTPESDEEFLRRVRERAEEQRRKAKEMKDRETRDADEGEAEAQSPD